jgi:hypothetical protein
MRDDEIKKIVKETFFEKAPAGLSDRIMEQIALEDQQASIASNYALPGKGLLVFLFLLFSAGIIWASISSYELNENVKALKDKITFDFPTISFNTLIFNDINTYLFIGFFIFLILEVLLIRKENVQII